MASTTQFFRRFTIVENHNYLRNEGDIDPAGKVVAIVKIKLTREYVESDIPAAMASRWEPGYYSWELMDIRPVENSKTVIAARGIYDIDFINL